jgi:multisubunit Na+/H+ antiporter MnhE subunit
MKRFIAFIIGALLGWMLVEGVFPYQPTGVMLGVVLGCGAIAVLLTKE